MRIALLQINSTVGDLAGNAAKVASGVRLARADNVNLVVTPELALLGYPPRDLLLNSGFVSQSWKALRELAAQLVGCPPVLVGLAEVNPREVGRLLFNSAALLRGGRVERCFRESLLPTYDVFDEARHFEPSEGPQILDLDGWHVGVTICEDIWNDQDFWQRRRYHSDLVLQLSYAGADCVVNLSASPFTVGKQALREAMLGSMASKHGVPLVYVNQVGGNDDLVFEGRSCAFDRTGRLIARGKPFAEDTVVVDLTATDGQVSPDDFTPEAEIWGALVLGTRDYVKKCGFSCVVLGLSGGIDSSITAAIAAEAVGPDNVLGVLMPSPFSSQGSIEDAECVASNLGVRTVRLPIAQLMETFEKTLQPVFEGRPADVTEENIQARIRGDLLMALSNKLGSLLLTTGNKSELAVGYCTLYGDMSGGLAVISDVPKTMIYRLARWLNRGREVIPPAVLSKPPSAELRPGQTDQDSLPDYDILDQILLRHIEGHMSAQEIVDEGFEESTVRKVLRLVKAAEFKRKQAGPGLKVTDRAFEAGWHMPIACRQWDKTTETGKGIRQ